MLVLQTCRTASRCRQRVCNRDAGRIPLRDLVLLCCIINGRIKHPTLGSAAQVIHKAPGAVLRGRNHLCHSSALLGVQREKQPVKRDASPRLCELIESSKGLFGPRVSRQKKPHLN